MVILRRLGIDLRAEDSDIPQVAIDLAVIEPVPDHELVGNREPDVIDLDLDQAAGRLVEKRADPQ